MSDDILDILEDLGTETDDAIERFVDDEELYLSYVQKFPQEPTMPALAAAMAAGDWSAAEKTAHALKGLGSNMGFVPLADHAAEVVYALRQKDLPAAQDAYRALQTTYQNYCRAIDG